ncbi:hypothetical protein [Bryocella elongata]|uniref:hypothetical protein n=1 Tax=Bryocella elongata TaxID=863522 RepID=UPI001F458D09|nr:hypothetical protein [Bryocella elongata]
MGAFDGLHQFQLALSPFDAAHAQDAIFELFDWSRFFKVEEHRVNCVGDQTDERLLRLRKIAPDAPCFRFGVREEHSAHLDERSLCAAKALQQDEHRTLVRFAIHEGTRNHLHVFRSR